MKGYAKTTNQGTAASETALCAAHYTAENRGRIDSYVRLLPGHADITGPWVECTDNDALTCIVCFRPFPELRREEI